MGVEIVHFNCWEASMLKFNLKVSKYEHRSSSETKIVAIGFSRVYSNTLATLFAHYPTVWTVKCSVVGTRVLAVL